MYFSQPMSDLVPARRSSRIYAESPIEEDKYRALVDFVAALPPGPFGTSARFELFAATAQDNAALRGLWTYGFIRGAQAFLIGAAFPGDNTLEDFGYRMETFVLYATGLGLGTCWLGGSFARSAFMRKIAARSGELIPAVISLGYPAANGRQRDEAIRQRAGSTSRRGWDSLFFERAFGRPLPQQQAGPYAVPLEMVRLGPSASNKQPWRIVRDGDGWHFYLQRTPGYQERWVMRLLGVADMQRIDLGIAMCHFELAAREAGLSGRWAVREPAIGKPDEMTAYVATWVPQA